MNKQKREYPEVFKEQAISLLRSSDRSAANSEREQVRCRCDRGHYVQLNAQSGCQHEVAPVSPCSLESICDEPDLDASETLSQVEPTE